MTLLPSQYSHLEDQVLQALEILHPVGNCLLLSLALSLLLSFDEDHVDLALLFTLFEFIMVIPTSIQCTIWLWWVLSCCVVADRYHYH